MAERLPSISCSINQARNRQGSGSRADRLEVEKLRDLLYQQARAASRDATQTAGQVSAEQLKALGRLARLVELCDIAQPASRKRWPLLSVLAVTLVIVSILLFARVSETEIELPVTVSEVSFVSPRQQMLTNLMQLSALGVSGLQKTRLPRRWDPTPQTLNMSEGATSAIRVSVASDGERGGTITLAPLMLPAGTHLWLSHTDVPNQFRLSLKGTGLIIRADVNGLVRIGLSGAAAEEFNFLSPSSILLQPDSNEVDLDLTCLGRRRLAFLRSSLQTISLFSVSTSSSTPGSR